MAPDKSWAYSHFKEHPLLASRQPIAYADGDTKKKKKLWCILCWDRAYQSEVEADHQAIQQGQRTVPRSSEAIEAFLWGGSEADLKSRSLHWIVSRLENVLRHLKKCGFQTLAISEKATNDLIASGINRSPGGLKRQRAESSSSMSPGLGYLQQIPALSIGPSPFLPHLALPAASTSSLGLVVNPSPLGQLSPLLFMSDGSPTLPSTTFPPGISPGPYTSNEPSPASNHSQELLGVGPPPKRSRTSRSTSRCSSLTPAPSVPIWTSDNQERFASALARITASCGLAYSWVENPEVVAFLAEFLPFATPISRRQLADKYIPSEVTKIRAVAKKACSGTLATLQSDGWSGINFHHFLAFMITTHKRELYTVKVFDTSSERKTAEKLVEAIKQVLKLLRDDWKVTIIAITTDAAGEAKKARKLCLKADPALITPDCWAHQNALVVGDYMKAAKQHGLLAHTHTEDANELITWLRSKTQILGLLRDVQEDAKRQDPSKQVLSVIRPVATRWTAYYLAYTRLILLRPPLLYVANQYETRLLDAKTVAARTKARKLVNLIQDATFWRSILIITKHLEPLARSSCILQASHARLDQVPIVFGSLLLEYDRMTLDPTLKDTADLIKIITNSIESRWKACDQDPHLAALLFHPLIKTAPFDSSAALATPAGAWILVKKLYKRFFGNDVPSSLFADLNTYLNGTGAYENLVEYGMCIKAEADKLNEHPDPLKMWEGIIKQHEITPLQKLAVRVLSVCCNSASCKRLFSMFGLILTKLRSRLRAAKMVETAELRMYLRDAHIKSGSAASRLKRKTTSHTAPEQPSSTDPPSTAPTDPLPSQSTTTLPIPTAPAVASDDEMIDLSSDENALLGAEEAASRSTRQKFSSIVQDLSNAATAAAAEQDSDDEDSDEDDSEDTEMTDQTPQTTSRPQQRNNQSSGATSTAKIPLSTLFDFNNTYWTTYSTASAARSLHDELELHELLDQETGGEPEEMDNDDDVSHLTV